MIRFDVLTLFPEIIDAYKDQSIIKRASEAGLISISTYNIRDYSEDRHRKTDDYPYSGGGGMIMTPQPIFSAVDDIKEKSGKPIKCIYMSPQGRIINNDMLTEYSNCEEILFLCGHYEGIDQRIIDALIDDEVSIGDYVLTGGELPALVFIDAVSRFVRGVLATDGAFINDSHYNGLLEHPQYTRPYEYKGMKVPDILLSGNEAMINKWKRLMSIRMTMEKRPDIKIEKYASREEIIEAENIDNLFTHK